MGQKNYPICIDREAMKVSANTHCQNSLPVQNIMLEIAQIFFENSYE